MKVYNSLDHAVAGAEFALRGCSDVVNTGHWQGEDISEDSARDTFEVLHHSFKAPIPGTIQELQRQVRPHMPWAEDHFIERIGGEGVNPGETYKEWPFYKARKENDRFRTEHGKFSHTYMERYWPNDIDSRPYEGIRYRYGDLHDVVELLHRQPYTRQAYLPVWFPEDTGAHHGGRVPCTLGYHFLFRKGKLHVTYYIRSCDLLRHFPDDVYLTCRLLQWVKNKLVEKTFSWASVDPGDLVMHIGSLHMFRADRRALGWDRE